LACETKRDKLNAEAMAIGRAPSSIVEITMAVAHARKPIKSNRLIKIVAGNCWDNALPESFFATVKTELSEC
jgi:hypothetical protein